MLGGTSVKDISFARGRVVFLCRFFRDVRVNVVCLLAQACTSCGDRHLLSLRGESVSKDSPKGTFGIRLGNDPRQCKQKLSVRLSSENAHSPGFIKKQA